MVSDGYTVRLAHPDGRYVGRYLGADTVPDAVIEVRGRRWRIVELPANRPGTIVVVPERRETA